MTHGPGALRALIYRLCNCRPRVQSTVRGHLRTGSAAEFLENPGRYPVIPDIQPGDLIRYGLIPEFVGRLPVAGVMNDLDKNALVRILTEPKNALLKQYQRLFEFENVRLRFTDDGLETVAELALQRKVGARGLRMILEDLMLELMYHLPMQRKVRDFVVSAEMVRTREINWSLLEKAG